jgi:hypothetical protein
MSCLNISYINTIHIGVHQCNYNATRCSYIWELFEHGLVCFISTPIWFPYGAFVLFRTSCCDVTYCTFLCFQVWFSSFYGFIHLQCFNVLCQLLVYTGWWWLYKPKHVAHSHTIKINKLVIRSKCEWDFDSCFWEGKRIKKYKLTQQDVLLENYIYSLWLRVLTFTYKKKKKNLQKCININYSHCFSVTIIHSILSPCIFCNIPLH